nr:expressed protein [Hymenolepis microstoma]
MIIQGQSQHRIDDQHERQHRIDDQHQRQHRIDDQHQRRSSKVMSQPHDLPTMSGNQQPGDSLTEVSEYSQA